VLDFLDEHFAEPIMVSEMASMAEMSKSHFIRFFTKVTGQTFVAYVTHLRVAKAQRLLAATNLPIAELCQQVGFCDQSYFGMVFRKAVGMPPGQYRRRYSGTAVEDTLAHHPSGLGQDNLAPESISASEKRSPAGYPNPAGQRVMKPGEFVQ
jgi:AraC-like DNA-binding protein